MAEVKPLADLCDPARSICYGIVQPGRHVATGLPIIRVADLRGNQLDLSEVMRVEPDVEAKYRRSRVRTGDVLVSLVGSLGQVVIAPEAIDGCNIARAVGLIPAKDRHHADWIVYSLQSPQAQQFIQTHANTTVQATFNLKDLARIPIPYPPRAEREGTLAVLGALDDRIELNRRMNRTLEAMARALYRSWFVDFDPVRAKAEGRAPAHMDPATAALFPARFSEGGLPEGWLSKPIGEAADIVGGSTPSTRNPVFWDGAFLWATPRDLSKLQTPILLDTERKITDAGVQQISSRQLPAGTLLLSSRAPIGYLAIARQPVSVNQGFIAIRETGEVSGVHALFWCRENMETIIANANGSTFQEISKRNFRPMPIVVAPAPIRDAFDQQAGRLVDLVAANEVQSRTLAALRDALLPKLMSGELRVRDAERALAKAV